MTRTQIEFAFLNIGHFFDHLFMLVFATAAALILTREWGMSYAELIPYATPGFVAFAACSIPAGWLADKWSRKGMMAIFFIGIGASSALTALAQSPLQIAFGLFAIGVFAAIYHPVGLSMVVQGREKTGVPLAVNGVFGNLGVASAALITGFLIDTTGWQSAFIAPGIFSIAIGLAYVAFLYSERNTSVTAAAAGPKKSSPTEQKDLPRAVLIRLFSIIIFSTAVGGLIFQSTTFALPEVFDERLKDLAGSATQVGWYAFLVFTIAAFAQLAVGYFVDHQSIRTVFAVVAALQMIFLAGMIHLTGVAALFVSVAFMLAVFGQIPINDVLIARATKPEYRSRVYSLRYIVAFTVSASAVPVIAWIHGGWGFSVLFIVLAAGAAAILVSVLMLPRSASFIRTPSIVG
ncbi:MAG: MFS transporter [Rhodospirillaceae bacterium]|nr:MFS transporter [Rhodospirillaceae bacterium]